MPTPKKPTPNTTPGALSPNHQLGGQDAPVGGDTLMSISDGSEAQDLGAAKAELVVEKFLPDGWSGWHSGGGCWALRLDALEGAGDSFHALLTAHDHDDIPVRADEPSWMGIYTPDGDCIWEPQPMFVGTAEACAREGEAVIEMIRRMQSPEGETDSQAVEDMLREVLGARGWKYLSAPEVDAVENTWRVEPSADGYRIVDDCWRDGNPRLVVDGITDLGIAKQVQKVPEIGHLLVTVNERLNDFYGVTAADWGGSPLHDDIRSMLTAERKGKELVHAIPHMVRLLARIDEAFNDHFGVTEKDQGGDALHDRVRELLAIRVEILCEVEKQYLEQQNNLREYGSISFSNKVALGWLEKMVAEQRRDVVPMAFGVVEPGGKVEPAGEVIESVSWVREDGRRASIYGALPWTSEAEAAKWQKQKDGYTIRWADGRVGYGQPACRTPEEAFEVLAATQLRRQTHFGSDSAEARFLAACSDAFRVHEGLRSVEAVNCLLPNGKSELRVMQDPSWKRLAPHIENGLWLAGLKVAEGCPVGKAFAVHRVALSEEMVKVMREERLARTNTPEGLVAYLLECECAASIQGGVLTLADGASFDLTKLKGNSRA